MKIYVDDSKTKEKIRGPEDVELLQENLEQLYLWGNKITCSLMEQSSKCSDLE